MLREAQGKHVGLGSWGKGAATGCTMWSPRSTVWGYGYGWKNTAGWGMGCGLGLCHCSEFLGGVICSALEVATAGAAHEVSTIQLGTWSLPPGVSGLTHNTCKDSFLPPSPPG